MMIPEGWIRNEAARDRATVDREGKIESGSTISMGKGVIGESVEGNSFDNPLIRQSKLLEGNRVQQELRIGCL